MGRPTEAQNRIAAEYGKPIPEILQEYYIDKNMHSSELAKMLGVTPGVIVTWCHKFGIPVKPKGGRYKVPPSAYPEIIRLYNNGKSSTEIARLYGCNGSTITLILNKNNVKIRGYRERLERKYSFDERYFQNIDTPMKAYFLGWAMSDGCVIYDPNGSRFALKIKEADVEILKKLKSELNYNGPISIETKGRKHPAKRINIYSATFVEDLISHGVIPRKSKILTKPKGIPTELECHFIRGYFDGDGSVMLAQKNTNFYRLEFSGNITTIEWIGKCLEKHTGLKRNKVSARNSYFATLSYSCSKVPIIRDYMYPTGGEFGLTRKKKILFAIQ